MANLAFGPLLTLLGYLLLSVHNAETSLCGYKLPKEAKIIHGVPIESTKRIQRRSVFKKFRIKIYYDSSVDRLPARYRTYLRDKLLPESVGYWEKALQVKRTNGPIRLYRECPGSESIIAPSDLQRYCPGRCQPSTTCGEVVVPESHLLQCQVCRRTSFGSYACSARGRGNGAGVFNADFLLYVSAKNTLTCREGGPDANVVAYASHCQTEKSLDRPIAGHVNLCPYVLRRGLDQHRFMLDSVKHEILHSLGFAVNLFAFFRDDHGRPRTPRNEAGIPRIFNRILGVYQWSSQVGRMVKRENWWTASGKTTRRFHHLVMPRVKNEARRHFNCPKLEGAELENQGDGLMLSHWEKRIFENEAMTGSHSHDSRFSRLTFALLEDTGWYKADYSMADPLVYGRGLGCEFAMQSCGSWISKRLSRGVSVAPYCNDAGTTIGCTATRTGAGICNLVQYQYGLPGKYRNYKSLNGIPSGKTWTYGASMFLSDYCATNETFVYSQEIKLIRRNTRVMTKRPSDCTVKLTRIQVQALDTLELFGKQSACLLNETPWIKRRCKKVVKAKKASAGCYEYSCIKGRIVLRFRGDQEQYRCRYDGEVIPVRTIHKGWLYDAQVVCPKCSDLCGQSCHRLTKSGKKLKKRKVKKLLIPCN